MVLIVLLFAHARLRSVITGSILVCVPPHRPYVRWLLLVNILAQARVIHACHMRQRSHTVEFVFDLSAF